MAKFKLDHVAVAVSNLDEAVDNFQSKLGIPCEKIEEVAAEKVKVAFFDLGGPHLELVSPTESESAMGRSLEKRGEGLHHICLEVDDIVSTMNLIKLAGLEMTTEEPTPGSRGTKITFIKPKGMHKVLIELVEKPKSDNP